MVDGAAYRLSIDAELEAFRPEIEYVCDFLDSAYRLTRTVSADRTLHYGRTALEGAINVPAVFFPKFVTLEADGLYLDRGNFDAWEADRTSAALMPPIGSGAKNGTMAYDALGLVFFMLSRIEERGAAPLDGYGRVSLDQSFAARIGRYANPLADEAADQIAARLAGDSKPSHRDRFRIRLTHDVDILKGYHQWYLPARYALGDVLKRGAPRTALNRLRDAYFSGQPWRSFHEIMDGTERRGLKSSFYFMGPTSHAMDSPYAVHMADLLQHVSREVRGRGHEVGFHPGFETHADADEWMRQKSGLESIVGEEVRSGRQHVLRYHPEETPAIWEAAGMVRDESLAFPEATGFRSGTCRPFHAYDLGNRRARSLVQCATAIMEFGLFGGKYRDLSVDEALDDCRPAIEACRKYGGELVVLYHTGNQPPQARTFYYRLLEKVA